MSSYVRPASQDLAAENHSHTDDRWTLLNHADPAAEPQSNSDDRQTPQQGRQPTEVRISKEPRDWINEEEWTKYIQEDCDCNRLPSVVSIFRVPKFLKELKREAYVPQRVSLGPYHHRSAELSPMNSHKGKALRRMMTRSEGPNEKGFSVRAKGEILQLEDEIRKMYEEKIDCKGEIFALMLSLDGCFILEILRTLFEEFVQPSQAISKCYEPIFEANKIYLTGFDILNDFLMLENQIPLFVLRKLLQLELTEVDGVEEKLFELLVKGPGIKFYPFEYDKSRWRLPPDEQNVHHLLGLLHNLIVSPPAPTDWSYQRKKNLIASPPSERAVQVDPNSLNEATKNVRRIPRAVELRDAGIKFEQCNGGIMGIGFDPKTATIHLPPINITDHTEVLFRNLIAFEMCNAFESNYVTNYMSLMNELINSEEDVTLLRRMGIVTHWLGSDAEIAELFNGVCKGLRVRRKDSFKHLKRQVSDHYNKKLKVQFAKLVKEHCSSPCKPLTVAGVITMLLLEAVQALFSILSVVYE